MLSDVFQCHPSSSDAFWRLSMYFNVFWCLLISANIIWCLLILFWFRLIPSNVFENWNFLSYILLEWLHKHYWLLGKDFEIVYLKVSKLHRQIDFQAPVFFPKLKGKIHSCCYDIRSYYLSVEISLIFFGLFLVQSRAWPKVSESSHRDAVD